MSFIEMYKRIECDTKKRESFISSAVNQNKRIYGLFNTNIKTLNTFYSYVKDIDSKEDNHQKIQPLIKARLLSRNNDGEIVCRQSILKKVSECSFEKEKCIHEFVMFLMLLDSDYKISRGSEFLMDILSYEMIANYNVYLKKLNSQKKTESMTNPLFASFVLYSDKDLLHEYFCEYPLDDKTKNFILDESKNINSMLYKRIETAQFSSFKHEASIGGLYFSLCDLDFSSSNSYKERIDAIISKYENYFIETTGKNNSPSKSDWNKLKKFLNCLTEGEKQIVSNALGAMNENSGEFSTKPERRLINVDEEVKKIVAGGSKERVTKIRVGQSKFKRLLFMQSGNKAFCRVCGCPITEDRFLIASHIKEWKDSNEKEKVDPNNGLLLCPAHDYLFDRHLITFDEDGKIKISEKITEDIYKAFNIESNDKIDVLNDNKKYLKFHNTKYEDLSD